MQERTRLQKYALELYSIAEGMADCQRDNDRLKDKVDDREGTIEELRRQLAELTRHVETIGANKEWKHTKLDLPPEKKKLLVRDKNMEVALAYLDGRSWFSGNTRLEIRPIHWMRIPTK